MTQDHSEKSYQNFSEAVKFSGTAIPVYFLAGNHDEPELLNEYLSEFPFNSDKTITNEAWQIQLLHSKSATPSGLITDKESARLLNVIDKNKHQFILMHHHPANVDYFIDKHGLLAKDNFYRTLNQIDNIKAIGCGHVHNAIDLKVDTGEKNIPLFTCPATSIQFERSTSALENSGKQAGYRIFDLHNDGVVNNHVIFLR